MTDIQSIVAAQPKLIARTTDEGYPFGWTAVTDHHDIGVPQGNGKTELDALRDLMEQYTDNLPKIDRPGLDAIEAYHVKMMEAHHLAEHWENEGSEFSRGSLSGFRLGYGAALAAMLELLE